MGATRDGGDHIIAGQSFGTAWSGGHALLSYDYTKQDPINSNERRYSATIDPPMTLTPENERHSVLLSLKQSLGDRYELFAQGWVRSAMR